MKLPYIRWFYFSLFLVANLLLAYGSFPLSGRLWILLVGLGFPFFFALSTLSPTPALEKPPYDADPLPFFRLSPLGTGILLGLMALITRFWGFPHSQRWRMADYSESFVGIKAIEFVHHWHWTPFFTFGQVSTSTSYLCAALLEITHSPVLSTRLASVLISLLTIGLVYRAARVFFARPFCALLAFFWVFNYWAFSVGQVLMPGILLAPWECWVFYNLGHYLKAPDPLASREWAALLGLSLGLGYLTFTSWLIVPLLISAVVLGKSLRGAHRDISPFLYFSLGGLLAALPFFIAVERGDFGGHLWMVSGLKNASWIDGLKVPAGYLSLVFWGGVDGVFAPAQGGFLSVPESSFFFLGCLELYRFRRDPLCQCLALSFFLFLIPGFLSKDIETYRILPVLLPLLAITAMGFQSLWLESLKMGKPLLLVLMVVLTAGAGAARLFLPLPDWGSARGSPHDRRLASLYLESLASQKGPGLVFCEMVPDTGDFSVVYNSYSFNAALNPGISPPIPAWAAIFTLKSYAPSLSSRFPQIQWVSLDGDKPDIPSPTLLGLVPLAPNNLSLFDSWKDFYRVYMQWDLRIMDCPDGKPLGGILENMLSFYPEVPDDVFLQSCFFDKLAYAYSFEKTFYPGDAFATWPNFEGVFRDSFKRGLQNSILCEKFGKLLASEGKNSEARTYFEKALKLSPGNPFLRDETRQLFSSP